MQWYWAVCRRGIAKVLFTLACAVGFILAAYASREDAANAAVARASVEQPAQLPRN